MRLPAVLACRDAKACMLVFVLPRADFDLIDGATREPPFQDILDMKPKSMEELTEVITAATFHPSHCNVFFYSSSRGCIKMGDMRASALCDKHAKGQFSPSILWLPHTCLYFRR